MPLAGSGKARPTPLSGAHAGSIRYVAAQRIALPETSAQRNRRGSADRQPGRAGTCPEPQPTPQPQGAMPSRRVAKRTRGVRDHTTPSGRGGVVWRAGRDAHQQICPWLSGWFGRATKPLLRGRLGCAGLKAGLPRTYGGRRRSAWWWVANRFVAMIEVQ